MNRDEKKYLELIFEYLEKVCGFNFDSEEIRIKYHLLEERLQQSKQSSFQDYYNFLNTQHLYAEKELQLLVNKIVNNNTSFFRYKPSFDLLEKIVLPKLFTSKFIHNNDVVRIWSAGCATGEEAYSIAISCLELMPDSNPVKIEIVATDISTENLEKAKGGYYSQQKISSILKRLKDKYFLERIGEDGILSYSPNKTLRKLISFQYLNLADEKSLFPSDVDIIFCRNVFPYLKKNFVIKILNKIYESLVPGGCLFLSATDHPIPNNELFELVSFGDSTCFRKRTNKVSDNKNTHSCSKNKIIFHPILNKTRIEKKKYKIDRVKDFISKLDLAHKQTLKADFEETVESAITYFGFKLDSNRFCIELKDVREVIHARFITPIPSSPLFIKGIVNYRGKVLTLLNIAQFLDSERDDFFDIDHLHVLVLNGYDGLLGIIISSNFTTFSAEDNHLKVLSGHGSYIHGTIDVDNISYKLIKINDLVSSEVLETVE